MANPALQALIQGLIENGWRKNAKNDVQWNPAYIEAKRNGQDTTGMMPFTDLQNDSSKLLGEHGIANELNARILGNSAEEDTRVKGAGEISKIETQAFRDKTDYSLQKAIQQASAVGDIETANHLKVLQASRNTGMGLPVDADTKGSGIDDLALNNVKTDLANKLGVASNPDVQAANIKELSNKGAISDADLAAKQIANKRAGIMDFAPDTTAVGVNTLVDSLNNPGTTFNAPRKEQSVEQSGGFPFKDPSTGQTTMMGGVTKVLSSYGQPAIGNIAGARASSAPIVDPTAIPSVIPNASPIPNVNINPSQDMVDRLNYQPTADLGNSIMGTNVTGASINPDVGGGFDMLGAIKMIHGMQAQKQAQQQQQPSGADGTTVWQPTAQPNATAGTPDNSGNGIMATIAKYLSLLGNRNPNASMN